MPEKEIPLLILCGPTAVGKTRMALELAEHFPNLEVISADSRQIFRYMDIGTAKPTAEERARLPHHFIDIVDPDEDYNAGQFGKEGRRVARELYVAGKIPIVVGGSGLYIRALVDGLFEGNVRDPEIKRQLQARADAEGVETLYRELQKVDPVTAARLHPNDRQRIVRALEVWVVAGEPISVLHKKLKPQTHVRPLLTALNRARKTLYEIIEKRVDAMIAAGLVEEVRGLRDRGYHRNLQSQKTVGYQEIHAYLEGEITLDNAVALIKRNTQRFAKRQLTWFRRDERIRWFEIPDDESWQDAKKFIIGLLRSLCEERILKQK